MVDLFRIACRWVARTEYIPNYRLEQSVSEPVGSPVKDSMKAKVDATDHHLLACIYGSEKAISLGELRDWAEQLGEGFTRFCGASGYRLTLLP